MTAFVSVTLLVVSLLPAANYVTAPALPAFNKPTPPAVVPQQDERPAVIYFDAPPRFSDAVILR